MAWLGALEDIVSVYASVLSIAGGVFGTRKLAREFKYRNIRRLFGIRDGEPIILVCSELDNPEIRQIVEPREFIYLMKYGDLDALVEVLFSLLRLYPNIDIRMLSSREAERGKLDLGYNMVLVGGPDYNWLTEKILGGNHLRIAYCSPDGASASTVAPGEIALRDTVTGREYVERTIEEDYGYFERIESPFDQTKKVIVIGGCHTVGVTAAAKAFSAFAEGRRDLTAVVKSNAEGVADFLPDDADFHIVVRARKIGSTIATPRLADMSMFVGRNPTPAIEWGRAPLFRRSTLHFLKFWS